MKGKCSVKGCERVSCIKGFCHLHYERFKTHGDPLIVKCERNGMRQAHLLEYNSWRDMKDRCINPNNNRYKYYGKRGIAVCKKWKESFTAFYNDMGSRPFSKAQIDRIDNDKGYNKNNCRWVSLVDNIRNQSTTKLNIKKVREIRKLRHDGYKLQPIADIYNIDRSTVSDVVRYKTWKNI